MFDKEYKRWSSLWQIFVNIFSTMALVLGILIFPHLMVLTIHIFSYFSIFKFDN